MKPKELIKRSPYKPEFKEVIYYKRESHDSFTIRLDWKLDHDPGQFVFCSIPGIGEAPISICSYSEDYIELNIREVGNVTNALSKIRKGDKLLVRGVYGKAYPMKEFRGKKILIIGGGCGVAPLKGVVEYLDKHHHEYGDILLFFGFRTPQDLLFASHIDTWNSKFHLEISFDKLGKAKKTSCYGGTQGFITQKVDSTIKKNDNMVAFICGPPIMISKTAEILQKKGFKDEDIFISAERLMYCGMGKCGRCMIHGKYTCLDGAVFRYDELKNYTDD